MSNKEVFFSIVIPTYNRAGYIGKTIRSLLATSYSSFEIIVVDDGSTDNTEAMVLGENDKHVRYYRKNNGERGAARNYGARLANGVYVNFFDSDDVAYSNHLNEAFKAVQGLGHPEVFHLGYDVKDDEGMLIRRVDDLPSTVNDRLIDGNHLSCNGVFLRKDICAQFPFNEDRVLSASEDYELWLRLASRFPFHGVREVTSTVVNHEARSVLRINAESFIARIRCLQENLGRDAMFVQRYGQRWKVLQAHLYVYMALHLAMANYPKGMSIKYLVRALLLNPWVFFTRGFLGALKNTMV